MGPYVTESSFAPTRDDLVLSTVEFEESRWRWFMRHFRRGFPAPTVSGGGKDWDMVVRKRGMAVYRAKVYDLTES